MAERKCVLVTGASGFIAKHVILELLLRGFDVRGSIRSTARGDEVRTAVAGHLAPDFDLSGRLSFVDLDLSDDNGWEAALRNVSALIHTASPFPIAQPDNAETLIRPAVDGTLRALKAAEKSGVRRVVLTSSIVAVTQLGAAGHNKIWDETDWCDPDNPLTSPYARSKALAERAAWDFVKAHPEMQLTTINPAWVLGPPLDLRYGSSVGLVARLLRAKDPAIPKLHMAIVDVRDVAAMHVSVLDNDATIGERLIASGGEMWLPEVAAQLATEYPARGIKTRIAPDWLLRIFAIFDREIRAALPLLNVTQEFSAAKAERLLGMSFVPAREAVRVSARALVDGALV